MILRFANGPAEGVRDIGQTAYEVIEVFVSIDGPPVLFTPPDNYTEKWEYQRAQLPDGSTVYIGAQVYEAGTVYVQPETWTRIGPFEVYNSSLAELEVTNFRTAIQFGDYRVKLAR